MFIGEGNGGKNRKCQENNAEHEKTYPGRFCSSHCFCSQGGNLKIRENGRVFLLFRWYGLEFCLSLNWWALPSPSGKCNVDECSAQLSLRSWTSHSKLGWCFKIKGPHLASFRSTFVLSLFKNKFLVRISQKIF